MSYVARLFRRIDVSATAEQAVLSSVLAIAALTSYTHLREVWLAAGSPWPDLGPLLVDGLFAAAWLRMRRRRRQGSPVGWMAWGALCLALVATVAGNLAAAWISGHRDPLALVVAAWPALAFALVWELVTGHGRTPSTRSPGEHQPDLNDLEEQEDVLAQLVAEGAGRQRAARELGVSEWEARKLMKAHRRDQEELA